MTDTVLRRVVTDAFGIEPSAAAGVLTLRLTGTGDTAAVAPLQTFLEAVAREVAPLELHRIVFDVRLLYLLNSSCLKAMLGFIFRIVSSDRACAVRFLVDPKLAWQRRSLAALVRMAPQLVGIDDDA
jgi:hypothetical protein